ncbi:MAG: SOS response-associated peptidase [Persicimonas sp.]
MCGRFTLATSPEEIARLFDLASAPDLQARYNIAPTQSVPVCRVLEDDNERRLDELRWGLVPFWADDPSIGNRMINARSETAASKPAYRVAFRRRRCLIPATGFYEWQKQDDGKQPYLFRRQDQKPFALAGLWESWSADDGAERLETFTILTRDADELVAPIHARMPVIATPSLFDVWLDPGNRQVEVLEELLEQPTPPGFESFAVGREVNNPRNDHPGLIEPS